jgi:spore coat polysaccharide biosynthesis predicted glycosyltransferase SpsG
VREVVISLGGGWDRGGIQPCLDALARRRERIRVQVLTTAANPSAPALQAWAAEHGRGWVEVQIDARDFASRLAAADLAIIAGGTTTFETAYLGVPALIIQIADNQAGQAAAWSHLGVADDLGPLATLDGHRLEAALDGIIADSGRRKHMSDTGQALVDGQGVYRVADAFLKGLESEANLLS